MELVFDKYEGLGNDFIVVDERDRPWEAWELAALCDRHRAIGADGVLVTGVRTDRPFMRVINADGSTPEMCGNGVRCVALYLAARGRVGAAFELDTDAGPHRVQILGDERVEVWMRPPSLDPARIPLDAPAPWRDEPIDVGGVSLRVTAVSMGNPHAVTFDDVGEARRELGPAIERHPRFPARANVGFATLAAEGIELVVWERGVGWTQACGTGACAAAVAAVETGRAARGDELEVRLPGGVLGIRVGEPGAPVRMVGPARHVFSGRVQLEP